MLEHIQIQSADTRAVVDALDPDLVRRMRNWVDWRGGSSVACSSSFALDYGTRFDRYREARMPVLIAEAQQTNRALGEIPDELGSAVALFWLAGEDASFRRMAVDLACSDKTVKARILRGHEVLRVTIYRLQEADDAKRAVNEHAAIR